MGGSLSHAPRDVMPASELVMIDAIQGSGDGALARGLYFVSETVEKTDRMLATMRKAVAYPVLLLIVFAGLLTGFSFFAVPILEELLPPEKWPLMGQVLYHIAFAVRHYGLYIVAAVLAVLGLFFYSLPNWSGPLCRKFDRWMPYSPVSYTHLTLPTKA